jgi:hypothetical protein
MQIDSEKDIERALRKDVEKILRGLCIKIYSSFFTGLPDRMLLLPGGKLLFVELKSTGKHQTERQKYVKRQLEKLGFRVLVIDTLQAVKDLINALKDARL